MIPSEPPLKNLVLDAWYKVLIVLGAFFLMLSLLFEVKSIPNRTVQLLSTGAILIGLGEWKNHKHTGRLEPPSPGIPALWYPRIIWSPDLIGIALDAAGIFLLYLGLRPLLQAIPPLILLSRYNSLDIDSFIILSLIQGVIR